MQDSRPDDKERILISTDSLATDEFLIDVNRQKQYSKGVIFISLKNYAIETNAHNLKREVDIKAINKN